MNLKNEFKIYNIKMAFSSVTDVLNNPLLLRNTLLDSDYDTIINYCNAYPEADDICGDNVFWEQKAQQDFNIPIDIFRDTTLTPIQRYFQYLNAGSPSVGSITSASNQASEELGLRGDPRYQYTFQTDQHGNKRIVPKTGAPADAMEKLQLSDELTRRILMKQGFRWYNI
jgi:hypothetical protein